MATAMVFAKSIEASEARMVSTAVMVTRATVVMDIRTVANTRAGAAGRMIMAADMP